MYKKLEKIESILSSKDITGYKIEIYTLEKNYGVCKPEMEYQKSNAIGFEM